MKNLTVILLAVLVTLIVGFNGPAVPGPFSMVAGIFIVAAIWAMALGLVIDRK